MIFNEHSRIRDKHALLSPSQSSWLNYDDEKMVTRYYAASAAKRGVWKHELAYRAILLGMRLDPSEGAVAEYVNDALEFKMKPEQPLFYSENCFGHADTISFRDGVLRIHDLKTGLGKVNARQLEVYAALFCLEYNVDPHSIKIELRIYQADAVEIFNPHPDLIQGWMERIVHLDVIVQDLRDAEKIH